MCLVQPANPSQLLDIENIISLGNKRVIGFIYEPIGPITNPLYSVQLYPEYVDYVTAREGFVGMREALHCEEVFLVKRTLKVINNQL